VEKMYQMKTICLFISLLISIASKAGSCSATLTGNWESTATWSCGHVPGLGDSVIIPSGYIVTVNANNNTNIGNLLISGTLKFTNGAKIDLASTSILQLYASGSIVGGNGGSHIVFPSASYSGPFASTGPYYYSNGGTGTGVLPLILVSFSAGLKYSQVVLNWKTENEDNVNFFEIEYSSTGRDDWRILQTIASMAENRGGYSYSYADNNTPKADRYYRLKMSDNNGSFSYSSIQLVSVNNIAAFSVTPTVVQSSINISVPKNEPATVSIFSMSGQLMKNIHVNNAVASINADELRRGQYCLKIMQGQDIFVTKFFKQ
jgi:hypothetical protein